MYCETEKGLFAVVCDGIGSRSGGGDSARLAAERFVEQFETAFDGDYPNFIIDAAAKIDKAIFEEHGNSCGTTAVTAFISGDELYWFSVGDSRLYIARDGRLKQITTDHNYKYVIDIRRRKNLIDEEEYNAECGKGERLASFIGMGGIDILDVSLQPIKLIKGDRLLLMTDGLYKCLDESMILGLLSAPADISTAADSLMSAVKECSAPIDNTTFALIDNSTEEF